MCEVSVSSVEEFYSDVSMKPDGRAVVDRGLAGTAVSLFSSFHVYTWILSFTWILFLLL